MTETDVKTGGYRAEPCGPNSIVALLVGGHGTEAGEMGVRRATQLAREFLWDAIGLHPINCRG